MSDVQLKEITNSVREFSTNLTRKLNDPTLHIELNASKIHSYSPILFLDKLFSSWMVNLPKILKWNSTIYSVRSSRTISGKSALIQERNRFQTQGFGKIIRSTDISGNCRRLLGKLPTIYLRASVYQQ